MSLGVIVQDGVVINQTFYADACRQADFAIIDIGEDSFRGIAAPTSPYLMDPFCFWIEQHGLKPHVTFLRKSPAGQTEPNYIHHDAMMGDWTAILYLNPEPHPGDGTVFWQHVSGANEGDFDMDDTSQFVERFRVKAQFNRAVIFPSKWFHSRAIFENYGEGDNARLIQVAFGKVL